MRIVDSHLKLYDIEIWVLLTAIQSYMIVRYGYCRHPPEVIWMGGMGIV